MTITLNGTTGITSPAIDIATPLSVEDGGTGSTSTTYCNLASNVTGTLPVANGGTGATSITANGVVIGNGTSAVTTVAPSTSGNVLTSDGTSWVSSAPVSSGGFTLLGTLTTTSGNSQGLTGLNLTSYRQLYIVANGVSMNNSTAGIVYFSSDNSQTYAAMSGMNGSAFFMSTCVIDLVTGTYTNTPSYSSVTFVSAVAGATSTGRLNITNSSTSFYARAYSTFVFDSGSIQVYGVK